MNNNRNTNNNRRRGRGGNRQQGGGGQQVNRVDSRARGNAPQMLEKYRKLAHDAHLNGDRVQEETFLQFADHYFRVIADQRQRQEEMRVQRPDRWQEGGEGGWREDGEDQSDVAGEGEYSGYDQPQGYQRRDRAERFREESPREEARSEDSRADVPRADEAPVEISRGEVAREPAASGEEVAGRSAYEPADNPFVKDNRGSRGLRPRRDDRRERAPRPIEDERERSEFSDPPTLGLDPASLPPAISGGRDEGEVFADVEASPRPLRRPRRPRPPADDAGEALEAAT